MRRIIQTTAFLSFILVLGSCSTSRLLPADTSNHAKNLRSIEDKALVYVFRTSAFGAAIGFKLDLNHKEFATFYPNKFYLFVLEPGSYLFTSQTEKEDDIIVNVEGNKKYYLEVIPQIGLLTPRCKLELANPFEGDKKVQNCKLIGLNNEAKEVIGD